MKRKQLIFIFFSILFAFGAVSLRAQDSLLVNYQGKLTKPDGSAENRDINMTFTLYDAGGNALWDENLVVTVEDGVFNEVLGRQRKLERTLFTERNALYLGIKIEDEEEMDPRFK